MLYQTVLLTGSNGLVGRALLPLLAGRYEVRCLDVAKPADFVGDLRDGELVDRACRDVDAVIHVAALHGRAWQKAGDDAGFAVNVMGTRNILEACRKSGVKRVVYTSSIWATGHGVAPPYLPIDEDLPRRPAELYGLTKQLGEEMCAFYSLNHGFSTICLRPGGILPADAPPAARTNLLTGCVDVRDVARAHVLALQAPADLEHGRIVIMPDTPLCRAEPAEVRKDPVKVLERAFPGIAKLVQEGRLKLPAFGEWYTIERARRLLGYEPEHNFSIDDYSQGGPAA